MADFWQDCGRTFWKMYAIIVLWDEKKTGDYSYWIQLRLKASDSTCEKVLLGAFLYTLKTTYHTVTK